MSRSGIGDTVVVKPTSNIYTVLSAVALVAMVLALVCVWMRGSTLFDGLLSQSPSVRSTR